jgi:hypothetical protein
VKISKLRSCGLGGRTHRNGLAELAGLFDTFGKDVRVNKKSRMRNNVLGRTYRYVVCEMENRYGDVGPGQVRGRREIGRLREQQNNVTGGIWYGKGESVVVSTCVNKKKKTLRFGWRDAFGRLTDAVHYRRREQVQRNL